jgi:hypothetical protein
VRLRIEKRAPTLIIPGSRDDLQSGGGQYGSKLSLISRETPNPRNLPRCENRGKKAISLWEPAAYIAIQADFAWDGLGNRYLFHDRLKEI